MSSIEIICCYLMILLQIQMLICKWKLSPKFSDNRWISGGECKILKENKRKINTYHKKTAWPVMSLTVFWVAKVQFLLGVRILFLLPCPDKLWSLSKFYLIDSGCKVTGAWSCHFYLAPFGVWNMPLLTHTS